MPDADPLEQWAKLREAHSRDLAALVVTGEALADEVDAHRVAAMNREQQMAEQLIDDEQPLHELLEVIERWHQRTHDAAWSVCGHPVCRCALELDQAAAGAAQPRTSGVLDFAAVR